MIQTVKIGSEVIVLDSEKNIQERITRLKKKKWCEKQWAFR
jgi:hypothetical protein